MRDMKLAVHAVMGEGNKLVFDVPQAMQEAIDVQSGAVIDLEQLVLWHDIVKVHQQHQDGNEVIEINVPASVVKNGSVATKDIIDFLKSKRCDDDAITYAEHLELMDLIYNSSRAVDERNLKQKK